MTDQVTIEGQDEEEVMIEVKRHQAFTSKLKNWFVSNRLTVAFLILAIACLGVYSGYNLIRFQIIEYRASLPTPINTDLQQIVSVNDDGVLVVYNAAESSAINQHKNAITAWAKENGHDAIVFGRIQPSMDSGEMKFATNDGRNQVPLTTVFSVLEKNKRVDAVSFMSNRSNFWLPKPFTKQVDGVLKIYKTDGIQVAGFSLLNGELRITSDNFDGTIEEGMIDGEFTKPWDAK
jgi:hypothetical protein